MHFRRHAINTIVCKLLTVFVALMALCADVSLRNKQTLDIPGCGGFRGCGVETSKFHWCSFYIGPYALSVFMIRAAKYTGGYCHSSRILQLEQAREADVEERKTIREECQRKVIEMEKKLQAVTRDKDSLKNLLHEAEVEIARRYAVCTSICVVC